MRILVVNCGSSTLKFALFEVTGTDDKQVQRLARGAVERIGQDATVDFTSDSGAISQQRASIGDHTAATHEVLRWLTSVGFGGDNIDAIGHRIVHGGDRFTAPVRIDAEVLRTIEEVTVLAPLHNRPALATIRAVNDLLGNTIPMVAAFDTAFHRTIPPRASLYAIPLELAEKHKIRRYGFHGLAHQSMVEHYATITERPVDEVKIITLQLGNGCSAAAIDHGRSVDTSMGLTPLEGLMMGTRSGDVDPSLAGFLAGKEGVSVDRAEAMLNTESGLLGVSGRSRDMRELLSAADAGDERASLAIEMFCYRVRKYIGAYLAAMGGAEAIVFGGGIGEHAAPVRARICAGMEWCGLAFDEEKNEAAVGIEARISRDESRLHAYVLPVNEELVVARGTAHLLTRD